MGSFSYDDFFYKRLKVVDTLHEISESTEFPVLCDLSAHYLPPFELLDYEQAFRKLSRNHDGADIGVHFYVNDSKLEKFWRQYDRYIPVLARASCILTPDYSMVPQMLTFQKRSAVFNSRLIGSLMQKNGLNVITTLQWDDESTYDFCFNDVPKNGVVSISTVGIAKTPSGSKSREVFCNGLREAMKRIQPRYALLYGVKIHEFDWGEPYYEEPHCNDTFFRKTRLNNTVFVEYCNSHFPKTKTTQTQNKEKKHG